MLEESLNCFGFCQKCQKIHNLPIGNSDRYAVELRDKLDAIGHIDFENLDNPNPLLSLDYLWGAARGQMFGVLECQNTQGETVVLKAFSSQYHGIWEVDGWAPTLFDVDNYWDLMAPVDAEIKYVSSLIDELEDKNSAELLSLKEERKKLSRDLMVELHATYRLHNFKGEVSSLYNAFIEKKGIPTGSGDCAAPKLLNWAARLGLKPIGISEFYYGKTNLSQSREHGRSYSSCIDKCQPILGFILCGLNEVDNE